MRKSFIASIYSIFDVTDVDLHILALISITSF